MISLPTMFCIILAVLLVIMIGQLLLCLRNNERIRKNYEELQRLAAEDDRDPVVESEKLLTFTRTFITQVVMLKFGQFRDAHDMSKITRTQIINELREITIGIEKSLNFNNIVFDQLVFTREFYDQYIVDFTVDTIKRITGQEVDNVVGPIH